MVNSPSQPTNTLIARVIRRCDVAVRGIDQSLGSTIWDRLTLAILLSLTVLVVLTFRDYGISTDEYVQQIYGEKLWAFYLSGFADRSVFHFDNLYLYGGLFDMAAVALQHISPLGIYETRHLLCGMIGVLGVAGTWRLGRAVAGPRTGFLAAALLALTASWYGAMFNNTKDIPFGVGMAWLLYFTCRIAADLPRPQLRHVICFGILLGLTLAVRVGAVLGVFYLCIAIAAHLLLVARNNSWRQSATTGTRIGIALLPAIPIALLGAGLFWPWVMFAPDNILIAARELAACRVPTVFRAQHLDTARAPLAYLPTYLVLKLPEITLIGLICAVGGGIATARTCTVRRVATSPWLIIVAAILIPIAYVLITQPAIYHGIRHFFFLLAPLCVLAAAGLGGVLDAAAQLGRPALAGLAAPLLLVLGQNLWTMAALHPNEYVYYNMLVGGVAGADRNYEMDYWQNFVPEAMQDLIEHVKAENGGRIPDRIFHVTVCGSNWLTTRYLPPNFQPARNWQETDYFIATTNAGCADAGDGKVIIEVERLNVVLGVVKDRRPGTMAEGTSRKSAVR